MATSQSTGTDVRRRKMSTFDQYDDDSVTIPSPKASNANEPGPLTKQSLFSLLIVMFSVFLDFMGMSIVQPILPFCAEKFGAAPTELGALYSSYAAMTMIAGLFMGKLSDVYGRKPMICFSLFGTCVGMLSCGFVQNYGQLLGCRFFAGAFGATYPVAMAVITDLIRPIDRPKWLAGLGTTVTVSFILGPGLGAGLAEFGIRIPFFTSAGLGAFGFLFALIYVRETHPLILRKRQLKKQRKLEAKVDDDEAENDVIDSTETNPLSDDTDYDAVDKIKVVQKMNDDDKLENEYSAKIPIQFWVLCIYSVLSSMSLTMLGPILPLYVNEVFGLSTLDVGYIILVIALCLTLSQPIFMIMSKYTGMYIAMIILCVICSIFWFFSPFVDDLWGFLAMVVFGVSLPFGALIPGTDSTSAMWTNPKNRGLVLGIADAADSVANIIGPLLMGALYGIDKKYPWYAAGACCLLGGGVLLIMVIIWPELRYPIKEKGDEIDEGISDEELTSIDWKFVPDRVSKKDYVKLGKALGVMLSNKKYQWVKNMDATLQYLDITIPMLDDSDLNIRRHNVKYVLSQAKEPNDGFLIAAAAAPLLP